MLVILPHTARADENSSADPFERRVLAFVQGYHTYVPYDSARALGHGATPILLKLLREGPREDWPNVVETLAFIGSDEAFPALRDLIESRFTGRIDDATLNAIVAALSTLGTIPKESAPELIPYLCSASSPEYWRRVHWTCRFPNEMRDRWLSDVSLSSLSWSGSEEADTCFAEALKAHPDAKRTAMIGEFREQNRRIKQIGMAEYTRLAREGLLTGQGSPQK